MTFNQFIKSTVVIAVLLFSTSCGSDTPIDEKKDVKSSNTVAADKPKEPYVLNIDVPMDSVIGIYLNNFDKQALSFQHGIATALQLKQEGYSFLSVDDFSGKVREFENGKELVDRMQAATDVRDLSMLVGGDFSALDADQKELLLECVSSLFYQFFINNPAFSQLKDEKFYDGLKQGWGRDGADFGAELATYMKFKTEFNKNIGEEFLKLNGKRPEVVETESGLQYEYLEKVEGGSMPKPSSKVKVHYHGVLLDGSTFDSSYERAEPIEFSLNQVIKGWTEGLQVMKKGEKIRLFIPYDIAYGNRGAGNIPPFSALIFDVELLDFN